MANIEVCPNCEVKTIKEAIEKAVPGESILVAAGVYLEHDITISKFIKIIGATEPSRSIIDIAEKGSGFIIDADHVEVSNFTIINSGFSHTKEMAGIKVSKSSNCIIKNNILKNNTFGIYIAESKSCLIDGNHVYGTNKSESLSGNGIHVWNGQNMKIENNELVGNRDGIYFEFVNNSTIHKNKSIGNLRYGLHFMYSHNNEYRENIFSGNECGVAVMYSRGVQMFRNTFEQSYGTSSYGILLKDISDSAVVGNIFLNNTIGIFIDGTTRTNFEGNLFKSNGWALRVLGDTDSNKFTRNDFISNTFDVTTNATTNENEFKENYWNRYKGLDLNNDGFGDEAYHPVHLSSMLISNYQASILLIHSLFFTILDQIESALPVLTPKTYNDTHPRMARVTDL